MNSISTSSDNYIGEIRMFAGNYEPAGWKFCDGKILLVKDYNELFTLIGKTYGGNGQTTFALPDFRGRVGVGSGHGTGLSDRKTGQTGGAEAISLSVSNMPPHNHQFFAASDTATRNTPTGGVFAKVVEATSVNAGYSKDRLADPKILHAGVLEPVFGENNQAKPHTNMMPSRIINYIIAMNGIYPSVG